MSGPASIIFVVGNSRSGTTMMGRVLGGHSRVFTFNELHFFEQRWQPTLPPPSMSHDRAVRMAATLLTTQRDGYYTPGDPDQYLDEAARIIEGIEGDPTPPAVFAAVLAYESQRHGKTIGCDQTPRNLYYLDELLQLYPDAQAVVLVRDPRDVMLSQKHRWKRRLLGARRTPRWNALRTWAGYHPITMSLLWRGGMRAAERLADHPCVTLLRFEDLVADPEAQVQRLCERLGLAFEPTMLHVPRVGSSHRPDEPASRGIDPSAAQRWRQGGLTAIEQAICQRLAGPTMQRWGYACEPVRASWLAWAWNAATWIFKSALAFALNARRARSLTQALRRRWGTR